MLLYVFILQQSRAFYPLISSWKIYLCCVGGEVQKIVKHFLFRDSIDYMLRMRALLPASSSSFPALPTLCPHLRLPPSSLLFLH